MAGARAELLSHAAADEHSRAGNPNAASTATLSLAIKLLGRPGKKNKEIPSRNPDSKVTHVHLFPFACVNAGAGVWVPAVGVCCNFGLIWWGKLVSGEKLQSNNS